MRYDHPELRDRLASEYALGTMRGGARRRFQRLMQDDPDLADIVRRWELRLNVLAEAAPPIEPPARIWAAIEDQIGLSQRPEPTIVPFPDAAERRARRAAAIWRGIGIAATAIAAMLALHIAVRQPAVQPEGTPVAVLSDDAGRAAFIVTAQPDSRKLALTRVATNEPEAGRAYQLWLLPKGGARPRSLGVLPGIRRASFELSPDDAKALPSADGIAISIEPAGGSPTGLPTGPIPFKGALIAQ